MKAWEIDDQNAYKYVRAVRKAIRAYFDKRNDELQADDMGTIIARCENTRAWSYITDILYGDIDIDKQED